MTSTNFTPSRIAKLRAWMLERNITFTNWAEQMQVSKQALSYVAKKETMPVHLYEKSIALGFPPELLPKPMNGKKPRPLPYFPGLAEKQPTDTYSS